jgi:hypothetical protein
MKKFKDVYSGKKQKLSENAYYNQFGDDVPVYSPSGMKKNYNDYEGRMAKQNLYKMHKYSRELFDLLDDHDELESWVQEKIAKAADYISSVKHYLEYEMEFGPEQNPYNSYVDDANYYDDDEMYEEVHHIDDLIPVLKHVVKTNENHKIILGDKIQVIIESEDAKELLDIYFKLNKENKKQFSLKLFESKDSFWNMVSFAHSRNL